MLFAEETAGCPEKKSIAGLPQYFGIAIGIAFRNRDRISALGLIKSRCPIVIPIPIAIPMYVVALNNMLRQEGSFLYPA
jgi:hypothetical protein